MQAEADGADQADRVYASPGGRGSKKQTAPWVLHGQGLLLAEVRARTRGAAPPRWGLLGRRGGQDRPCMRGEYQAMARVLTAVTPA